MKLFITQDTVFKPSPEQSITLPTDGIAKVKAGAHFDVLAYREDGEHLVVTLNPKTEDLVSVHPSGRNTWWVFKGHIKDPEGFSSSNNPRDNPAKKSPGRGFKFALPGYTGVYYSNDPIASFAPNFTWREALHFGSSGGYRRPANAGVVRQIIAAARNMQAIRERFGGKVITVTSWYRDPVTNAAVGGATQSRHMQGDAVDFQVAGLSPRDVYRALDAWHGSKGGLAHGVGFTHSDWRGYRARWSYPGAGR